MNKQNNKQNNSDLEKELEKKYLGRDKKKKKSMKISGASVKKLKKIIINKGHKSD